MKSLLKSALVSLFLSGLVLPGQAKPNELSVRYSNLTGYGAAYQRNFLTDYYVRTTAWFKYYEYIKGDADRPARMETNKNYNFGLDLQRNIISEDKYRVFGFLGGGYAIREKIKRLDMATSYSRDDFRQKLVTAGLGGGIEYYLMRNVALDFGVSYKFDYDVRTYTKESTKETGLGTMVGLNLRF